MTRSRWRTPVVALAIALTACGSNESAVETTSSSTPVAASTPPPTTLAVTTTAAEPTATAELATSTTDAPTTTSAPDTIAHAHDTTDSGSVAEHDHLDSTVTYGELSERTKLEVDLVIGVWAAKYATGADAAADGWMRATRSLYGIGAHYVRTSGFVVPPAAEFNIMEPNILLFDGEGPDAKFAGVSYVTKGIPEGFTGDDDTWHFHDSVCIGDGGVMSLIEEDSDVWLSAADCTAVGGRVAPLSGGDQMMHLWIGPGYIDSGPIMSHDHPLLLDGYNPQQNG